MHHFVCNTFSLVKSTLGPSLHFFPLPFSNPYFPITNLLINQITNLETESELQNLKSWKAKPKLIAEYSSSDYLAVKQSALDTHEPQKNKKGMPISQIFLHSFSSSSIPVINVQKLQRLEAWELNPHSPCLLDPSLLLRALLSLKPESSSSHSLSQRLLWFSAQSSTFCTTSGILSYTELKPYPLMQVLLWSSRDSHTKNWS